MASISIPTALSDRQPTPDWDKANRRAEKARNDRSGPRSATTGLTDWSDVIDRLPSRAARKLRELRRERDELGTLTQSDADAKMELISDRQKAAIRVMTLTDPDAAVRYGNGQVYDPAHPSVVQAKAEHARLSARLEELEIRKQARQPRFNALGNLLRRVEDYLRSLPREVEITTFETEPPDPVTSIAVAVEQLRERRRELLSDLKIIETAPCHSTVAKAKLRKQIDELAERGRPDVGRLFEGRPLALPKLTIRSDLQAFVAKIGEPTTVRGFASGRFDDSGAFMIWLFKDQIVEKLDAEISDESQDAAALSEEERAERSGAILAEMLAVERLEEGYCELAQGSIVRRSDTDPRAFLGIEGADPKGD